MLTISIIGRPNVGKSTLFNRLSTNRRSKAIVHNMPGVTRDRKYSPAKIGDLDFNIIDTPGLEESKSGQLEERMMQQTLLATDEADLNLFIVDSLTGITAADEHFASLLRKKNIPVLLVINKCEAKFHIDKQYYKLGFGEPITISAAHYLGFDSLYNILSEKIAAGAAIIHSQESELGQDLEENDNKVINVAIAGRPNSGKSTFINALLKENRVLTGPEAGVTRDSVEISWQYQDYNFNLVDTAGLRKKSNIKYSLEKLSAKETIETINFANVVILMIDATIALEKQDLTIASHIIDEGRGLVIAINKWDLIEDKKTLQSDIEHMVSRNLSQVKGAHIIFLSAEKGKNIEKVIEAAITVYQLWNMKISTGKLNKWLNDVTNYHQLPLLTSGRRIKLKYVTQTKTRPPTFKVFGNVPKALPASYKKFLLNSFREYFDIMGVPIRFIFTKTENPYEK